jgi:glycine dehydrogenase
LLALTLIKPPGEFGADIAVGSAQRFGVPLGYGGPHAAFFATRDEFKRQMPGPHRRRLQGFARQAGVAPGAPAPASSTSAAKRPRATSAPRRRCWRTWLRMYAVYHGPEGLKKIAERIHALTEILAEGLAKLGFNAGQASRLPNFDTLTISLGDTLAAGILKTAEAHRMNFRLIDDHTLGISLDETTTESDVAEILQIFNGDKPLNFSISELMPKSSNFELRTSNFLTHKVFNSYHSETEMLRYIKRLESRDLSLTASMIPLGSCTMKLNAAAEMFPDFVAGVCKDSSVRAV